MPRKISFTGSVAVGKHLQKLAAETLKRCTMELGGHAPFIVFDDAKFDRAVETAVAFKFRNAGQVCLSPSRFYIHEGIYDRFVDAFAEKTKALVVGNGLDDGAQMGPLVSHRRLGVMEHLVNDARGAGAEIVTGGDRLGNHGYFFAPTVIKNVPDHAAAMVEEPFGPLASMTTFRDFDDVVQRANSLEFGLAAYAFTSNAALAARLAEKLDAGMVGINHCMVSTAETPLGGVKESGYGSEGGIEGMAAYLRTKLVTEIDV